MAWGYFCLFYKKYIVYNIFNMTMHYPQSKYITVQSFMFRCVTVCELRLFKRKKKKQQQQRKMENLQKRLNLTPLSSIKLYHIINRSSVGNKLKVKVMKNLFNGDRPEQCLYIHSTNVLCDIEVKLQPECIHSWRCRAEGGTFSNKCFLSSDKLTTAFLRFQMT